MHRLPAPSPSTEELKASFRARFSDVTRPERETTSASSAAALRIVVEDQNVMLKQAKINQH